MPVLSPALSEVEGEAEGPPVRGLRREPVLSPALSIVEGLSKGSAERHGNPLCSKIVIYQYSIS